MNTQEVILTPWEGVDLKDLRISKRQETHDEITILIVDRNSAHYFELSAEKMSITKEDDNKGRFGLFIKTFKYYPQLLNEEIYKTAIKEFMNFAKFNRLIINNMLGCPYFQYVWAKFGPTKKAVIATKLGLRPTNINQNEADIIYMKEFIRK